MPTLWVRRLGFGTVFTNIILLWIRNFEKHRTFSNFFFKFFFFKIFFSIFFLRLQKCMHAFGVKLDYNNTFWQIDILLDQHLDKSIIILNCFPTLIFFRLQHFPTVITKMHAYFWSLIKLCIYNINLWTYKFIIL